jgi:hypothetical protein
MGLLDGRKRRVPVSRANLKAFRKGCCELHTPVVDYIQDSLLQQGA